MIWNVESGPASLLWKPVILPLSLCLPWGHPPPPDPGPWSSPNHQESLGISSSFSRTEISVSQEDRGRNDCFSLWSQMMALSLVEQELRHYWTSVNLMCAKLLQSCPTVWDSTDYSPPDSSVQEILQAGILEWVSMPSSRWSSQPRDWTQVSYVSCTGRRVLYHSCHLESPVNLSVPIFKMGIGTHRDTSSD